MKTLTITDTSVAGQILHEISLQFESEYISVRDLIEARIQEEIKKYEQKKGEYKSSLVVPSNLEERLNKKNKTSIDVEKQVYIAMDAFQKNGFFILIDDEQVVDLEQKFLIESTTQISFIKLTQLVGG